MPASDQPFFSIVVPVYQAASTLCRCVDSVLAQRENSYEVILVDDGSTDGSGTLCDRYAGVHPHCVRVMHKQNEGPLLARIDAIECACGRYLMFLDADDVYMPNALSLVRRAVETHDADMVVFNHVRVLSDGHVCRCEPQYAGDALLTDSGLAQLRKDAVEGPNLNALWQKCVRRDLVSNIGEFRLLGEMLMGEDKLLSLEMIDKARRVVYLADGLYEYHVTPHSLSRSLSSRHYEDMSVAYARTLRYAARWGLDAGETSLHADKVSSGLSCLRAVALRTGFRMAKGEDFVSLARYISADQEYWCAFEHCRKALPVRKRVVCWLLHGGFTWLVWALFRMWGRLRAD